MPVTSVRYYSNNTILTYYTIYSYTYTYTGDEGGFAPSIQSNYEGTDLLMEAIKLAGYEGKVGCVYIYTRVSVDEYVYNL